MDKLKDRYGRTMTYIRMSVTDRCNFRCRYCMPPEGVQWIPHDAVMRYEDIEFLLGVLMSMGIEKVRFTGGEPFIRKGFVEFLKCIGTRHKGLRIAVTTNGSLLDRHVGELAQSGIAGLNVSLDTLDRDRFRFITRSECYDNVLDGIRAFAEGTEIPLKINTVLIKGFNDTEMESLLSFAARHRAVLRFIEFMPLDEEVWSKERFISADCILNRLPGGNEDWRELPAESRHVLDGPARYYVNRETGQRIGIIAAVSNHFCDSCNRLRVTAKGEMRTCLFAGEGTQLLPTIRSRNADLLKASIVDAAYRKPKSWTSLENSERHMSQIGG